MGRGDCEGGGTGSGALSSVSAFSAFLALDCEGPDSFGPEPLPGSVMLIRPGTATYSIGDLEQTPRIRRRRRGRCTGEVVHTVAECPAGARLYPPHLTLGVAQELLGPLRLAGVVMTSGALTHFTNRFSSPLTSVRTALPTAVMPFVRPVR